MGTLILVVVSVVGLLAVAKERKNQKQHEELMKKALAYYEEDLKNGKTKEV